MGKAEEEEEEEEVKYFRINYLLYFEVIMHFCFHDTMQWIAFWEINLTPSGMGIFGIFWPDIPKPYITGVTNMIK